MGSLTSCRTTNPAGRTSAGSRGGVWSGGNQRSAETARPSARATGIGKLAADSGHRWPESAASSAGGRTSWPGPTAPALPGHFVRRPRGRTGPTRRCFGFRRGVRWRRASSAADHRECCAVAVRGPRLLHGCRFCTPKTSNRATVVGRHQQPRNTRCWWRWSMRGGTVRADPRAPTEVLSPSRPGSQQPGPATGTATGRTPVPHPAPKPPPHTAKINLPAHIRSADKTRQMWPQRADPGTSLFSGPPRSLCDRPACR